MEECSKPTEEMIKDPALDVDLEKMGWGSNAARLKPLLILLFTAKKSGELKRMIEKPGPVPWKDVSKG